MRQWFCALAAMILLSGAAQAASKQPLPHSKSKHNRLPPPVIIIDPGHGGKDPGALSRYKIREKDLVLSISKKLAVSLRRIAKTQVYLTRYTDKFVTLGARDEMANRHQCDLFLSIHANASTSVKAKGLELYYLNKATDSASARLASRENQGSSKKEKEMEIILADLIQTAATEESAELAAQVKDRLEIRLQKYDMKNLHVKTALFYVLVGAKCPSLLIETGFVTNPQEASRMRKAIYQKEMADAIAEGVRRYLKGLQRPDGDL